MDEKISNITFIETSMRNKLKYLILKRKKELEEEKRKKEKLQNKLSNYIEEDHI